MLSTIDLFSGIGGITRALHGIAEPIAYCDWALESRQCLESLFDRKLLKSAPICPDVREMDKSWLVKNTRNSIDSKDSTKYRVDSKDSTKYRVDMIVGGFPCVGFSPLGLREAFTNSESSLFSEILRLADVTKCPMLFLENVPNIVKLGMHDVVHELVKRGYELRWCIASAEMVGAPQRRSRWFCLAIKPEFRFTLEKSTKYKEYPWATMKEPPRAQIESPESGEISKLRKGMLGNSVVPDAVRYAFLYLVGRCQEIPTSLDTPRGWSIVPALKASRASQSRGVSRIEEYDSHGILELGSFEPLRIMNLPILHEPLRKKLVFDSKNFKTHKEPSPLLSTGILEEPLIATSWSTPRYSNTQPANYLTHRSVRDLPTQVRFEKKTPRRLRRGTVTPEFVEFLMGYPLGWTLFGALQSSKSSQPHTPARATALDLP